MIRKIKEQFIVKGHKNILAKHKTTIEFTKDSHLTKRGDCIIGIASEKGLADFGDEFKKLARSDNAIITCQIEINGHIETIIGQGSPALTFKDKNDIVIRKSNYICDRTIMIKSNKAAIDIDRNLIKLLQNPNAKMKVVFTVEHKT
ncbi:MAG: DUF371 domain-containing protein [Candidatus Helarchaeota archaeon]